MKPGAHTQRIWDGALGEPLECPNAAQALRAG